MRQQPFNLTLADKPITNQIAPDGTLWEKYRAEGTAHHEGRSFKVKPVELWVSDFNEWAAATEYVKPIMGKGSRNLAMDRDGIFLDRIPQERAPRDGGQAIWPLSQLFHVRVLHEQHRGKAMERYRERIQEERDRARREGVPVSGTTALLWGASA